MKQAIKIILALMIVFVMTQCKKKVETISNPVNDVKKVHVKLNVDNTRWVEPANGHFGFSNGDRVYVGYNGVCIGMLIFDDEEDHCLEGDIDDYDPEHDDYLHLYYMGPGYMESPTGGETYIDYNIADQREYLPVLSYGHTSVKYTGAGTYSCDFYNQCALVEFKLESTANPQTPVLVHNMPVGAKLDFANNRIVATNETGTMRLNNYYVNSENNSALWAILLPTSSELNTTAVVGGRAYNVTIPEISENDYLTGATAIDIDDTATPAADYFFTLNGNKVYFAPGNLVNYGGEPAYCFGVNQYDNADYTGDYANMDSISLFGWGTWVGGKTLDNGGPKTIETDDELYSYGADEEFEYDYLSSSYSGWRTITAEEMSDLFNEHTYKLGVVITDYFNGPVTGAAFRPDGQSNAFKDEYTIEKWEEEENTGALFLAFSGCRENDRLINSPWGYSNVEGFYWVKSGDADIAKCFLFYTFNDNWTYSQISTSGQKWYGGSVRLVRDAE